MPTPSEVAKYFLLRTADDGDLISPLKMQKLVYYAYAWHLVKTGKKLFDEPIEAWANGPVVPSLYRDLKEFGSSPISLEKFVGDEGSARDLVEQFSNETLIILDDVYNKYQILTPFELVMLTHQEKPWVEARKGTQAGEKSSTLILDQHILEQYILVEE